jgi:peptide/nickel transport system substrate-binding protein
VKEARELFDLYKQWEKAADSAARAEIWHKMLALYTDQAFSIGIVNGAKQPIVISAKLRNVPETALFSFDPTAYFGVYGMDTFWFDKKGP